MRKLAPFPAHLCTPTELRLFKKLNTYGKIQDYLFALPQNHEEDGDTCMSVRSTIAAGRAHCIEAAVLAAAALWYHGQRPLLLDFRAHNDFDHVMTLFQENGAWGAISKSNHAPLRYRDPVYPDVRTLAYSYVHEYWNTKGQKTLREYSAPIDLSTIDPALWLTNTDHCWELVGVINARKHYRLLTPAQAKLLRPIDTFERKLISLVQFSKQ